MTNNIKIQPRKLHTWAKRNPLRRP
jgi:hypothetical protein